MRKTRIRRIRRLNKQRLMLNNFHKKKLAIHCCIGGRTGQVKSKKTLSSKLFEYHVVVKDKMESAKSYKYGKY